MFAIIRLGDRALDVPKVINAVNYTPKWEGLAYK